VKIFISAGEPSGDLYGAILVQELKRQVPGIELEGIGGKLMAEAGVHLIKSIDELAIFGFYEGVKSYPKVRKVLREIVSHLRQNPPDVLLPIAFSNFNLMLLKNYLTSASWRGEPFNHLPVYYFAPPQLWAWGRWRGRLLKKYADAVICLFPFEEGFFNNMGINAVYLGNPLQDYVKSRQSKSAFLKTWSLNPDSCILSLMPGSRTDEVRHHLPLMLEIFSALGKDFPDLYGFVILSENIEFPDLPQADRLFYIRNRKYDIMKNSDLILLTSGTAALEAMILETPAVSIYTLSPLSYRIARFAVKLNSFSIPNLIAEKEIMPELVQPDFNTLYPMVFDLLMNQSMRQEVKKDFIEAKYRLGPPGAQKRIVKKILE
jgi:lipid-A-disaccharide synthase